jgi:hypothetical protein
MFFKYQNWYLKPRCGLQVHYPTSALKSVKDPGNIFNLSPTWAITLPSLIYFYGIFIETPLHNCFSNIKIDIWHPAVGLKCIIPPRHIIQLKTPAIPLTLIKVGKNFAVFDIFFYGIFIETPLHNFFSNIKVDIWHHAVGLRCIIPPRHLNLKDPGNTFNLAKSGQELCRPWYIFMGYL